MRKKGPAGKKIYRILAKNLLQNFILNEERGPMKSFWNLKQQWIKMAHQELLNKSKANWKT